MKIAIGQVFHEGNDFNFNPTLIGDFERQSVLVGEQMLDRIPNASELGGFIRFVGEGPKEVELVPTVRAIALPSGRVSNGTYSQLRSQLLAKLRQHDDLDGVFLSLHGAMVVDGIDDSEGDLLSAVRLIVGPSVPIAVTLDLHANITDRMVSNATVIAGYRTSPHEDMEELGHSTAALLFDLIEGRYPKLTCYWRKVPMISPTEKHVTCRDGPYASMYRHLAQRSTDLGIVSASLFTVTPWLDIPDLGFSAIAYSNGDGATAKQLVDDMCSLAWSVRHDLLVEKTPLNAAVEIGMQSQDPPVLLVNGSDSTLAGAPGDNTAVLAALLNGECDKPAYVAITDAEVVNEAKHEDIGEKISVTLGGKRDRRFCKPLTFTALLTDVVDASATIEGPVLQGLKVYLGRCILLAVGNIIIVVTEHVFPGHDPSVFRCVGLRPECAQVIVVNSTIHYRANYKHISNNEVLLDTPGASSSNLALLPYQNLRRPLFPIDEMK